jgi:hypothetical protein
MRDLAPGITRQRLLLEGYCSTAIDESTIRRFFDELAATLELRTYGEATIFAPGGLGRDNNEGFDAFIPLIDSGISLYAWTSQRFLAVVLFTCKSFDTDRAVTFTRESFGMTESEHQRF